MTVTGVAGYHARWDSGDYFGQRSPGRFGEALSVGQEKGRWADDPCIEPDYPPCSVLEAAHAGAVLDLHLMPMTSAFGIYHHDELKMWQS